MIDQEYFGPPSEWHADAETQALLDAQRAAVQSASIDSIRQPRVGDVWLSAARWSTGMEAAMTAMLVVLRVFTEAWSVRPLFDVAPVTEEERLASEWSLILGASQSGLGFPVIAHVDAQCTTTSSMLVRFVGVLADVARLDLDTLVRAYALGDDSVIELRIGRQGSINIRFHAEWEDFSRELVVLCQAFSAPLTVDRMKRDRATSDENADDAVDDHLLAVASGGKSEPGDWEYRPTPPFVYPRTASPKMRLGEAVACYYAEGRTSGAIGLGPCPPLDPGTFNRLLPFLDVLAEELFNHGKIQDTLLARTGAQPSFAEITIIVASIRSVKTAMASANGAKLTHLAARRPTPR